MGRPSVVRSLKVAKHSGGGREPRAVSDGTTLLFGLPGVQVERVERRPDGTRVVHVATADETAAACPGCGVVSTSVKEHVKTSPKDIPYGSDDIVVRWHKTRLALLGGLLPEVLVHRGHRADPGAGAHHYAVAHPDWGGDRRRRSCGGRGRRHPCGVLADRAPGVCRPRRDNAGRTRAGGSARH